MNAFVLARSLPELAAVAEAVGIRLDFPVGSVLPELELSVRVRFLVASRVAEAPALSLAELLRDLPASLRPRKVQRELLAALADWLPTRATRLEPEPPGTGAAFPEPLTAASLEEWARRHGIAPYLTAQLDRLARYAPRDRGHELAMRSSLDVRTALLLPAAGRTALPPWPGWSARRTFPRSTSLGTASVAGGSARPCRRRMSAWGAGIPGPGSPWMDRWRSTAAPSRCRLCWRPCGNAAPTCGSATTAGPA